MNQQQFNPNLPPGSTPGAPNYYAAAPNAPTQPYNQPQAAFGTAQQPAAAEPDLKKVETMGNGTLVKHYNDGRKSTVHPDGRTETVWPDGSTETVNPDGTKYHYTPTVPKEDYLDKAFAFGAKRMGIHVSREAAEKTTDKARGMFEKFTGKKLPSKISN